MFEDNPGLPLVILMFLYVFAFLGIEHCRNTYEADRDKYSDDCLSNNGKMIGDTCYLQNYGPWKNQ